MIVHIWISEYGVPFSLMPCPPGLILYGHCCDFSIMDPFRRQTPATKCSVSGTIQIFVSLDVWLTELKSLNETGHSPWGQKLLCTELPRIHFVEDECIRSIPLGTTPGRAWVEESSPMTYSNGGYYWHYRAIQSHLKMGWEGWHPGNSTWA